MWREVSVPIRGVQTLPCIRFTWSGRGWAGHPRASASASLVGPENLHF